MNKDCNIVLTFICKTKTKQSLSLFTKRVRELSLKSENNNKTIVNMILES